MRSIVLATAFLAALVAGVPAQGQESDATLPFVGAETPRGTHATVALAAVAPAPKTIDGHPGDWTGSPSGFGGSVVRSHGELIYTDHLFDAHGADDGQDAAALTQFDGVQSLVPEAYRLEAILRNDPLGQVGAPSPEQLQYKMEYGDLGLQDTADLTELRIAPAAGGIDLLARTTTMEDAAGTELLVLLDTADDGARREVAGAGITTGAEYAIRVAGASGTLENLTTGSRTDLPAVAVDPTGYVNAIEARVELALPDRLRVAAASVKAGGPLANVAFRTAEPVREFFDKRQALALHAGDIDEFLQPVDLAELRAGANERYVPGPGYHERVFTSSPEVASETGANGLLQHYGVYLPASHTPGTESPLQLWLHWRGGTAHSAGTTIPGMFRDLGERRGTIVVSPRGRGSSSWYVGRGYVDVEDVWRDLHATFDVDPDRRYLAGHSMGGWGTQLFAITHPDWFAAGLPASPPVTQGAWTGVDFEGCDELRFDEYTPCYIGANGGDPRAQHTLRMLDNLRHVPLSIYHGTADELVPTTGVTMNVRRLMELGYRHRYYLFHTQEHFGPPVWDQWEEGAAYMHRHTRPAAPHQVTFRRDMPFERATERINSGGVVLDFAFDSAYWMSGLRAADPEAGVATFDGRSHAIPERAHIALPEASAGGSTGQAGPYTMTGLTWIDDPLGALPAARNAFSATLGGATAVTLDLERMRIDTARVIDADVKTDRPLTLRLRGPWKRRPRVTMWGVPIAAERADDVVTLQLPAGTQRLLISP